MSIVMQEYGWAVLAVIMAAGFFWRFVDGRKSVEERIDKKIQDTNVVLDNKIDKVYDKIDKVLDKIELILLKYATQDELEEVKKELREVQKKLVSCKHCNLS